MIKYNKTELYLPIIYYFNLYNTHNNKDKTATHSFISPYNIEYFLSNNTINNINLDTVLHFLKKFNLYNNIINYIFSKVLNKYIGLTIEYHNYKLCFLFKPIHINYDIISNYDVEMIFYPIHEINDKIINKKYDIHLKKFTFNYYDIYYKNLYKLIIHEISNYFINKKDYNKRDLLIDLLNNNTLYNKLYLAIQLKFPNDYLKIDILINKIFKINNNIIIISNSLLNDFKILLNNTYFDFDNDIKHDFIKNSTFSNINQLFNKLFIFKNKKDILIKNDINNILLPCVLNNTPDYCDKNKLIIPFEFKNMFINLFYYDTKNNFNNKHLLNNILFIDDEYNFDINMNEIITIDYN